MLNKTAGFFSAAVPSVSAALALADQAKLQQLYDECHVDDKVEGITQAGSGRARGQANL